MDQFGVELEALDNIGAKRLPDIATSIANAAEELGNATDWITRTFDTRGESYREGEWNAEQPFLFYLFWRPGNECYYTMDFMRRIFADNRENVMLAAQAIREIALRYRQADGQA